MKILLVNKFYYYRGGAEVYMINLESMLRAQGHEVAVFSMSHSQNLPSHYEKLFPSELDFTRIRPRDFFTYIFRPLGTREVRKKFSRLLKEFRPDILHLNNVHSQLSPVIAQIAHKKGIRIVWTVHDYKMLCPRYDCIRNGKPCNLCYSGKWSVVRYSCMKNSRAASILAYWEAVKWNRKKLEEYTTTFICPSSFLRNDMICGGFNPSKLVKLNNFIDLTKMTQPVCTHKENYYCYIGRLSQEKGVETLLKAAVKLPYTLRVIGTGNLEQELKRKYQLPYIIFEGHKSWSEIEILAGQASFSVLPSECYENNPLSVIESLCLGTPVLGARIGGIPELIAEGKNGLLFESGNVADLSNKIKQMYQEKFDYETIAEEAQAAYSPKEYYSRLMGIYERTLPD